MGQQSYPPYTFHFKLHVYYHQDNGNEKGISRKRGICKFRGRQHLIETRKVFWEGDHKKEILPKSPVKTMGVQWVRNSDYVEGRKQ